MKINTIGLSKSIGICLLTATLFIFGNLKTYAQPQCTISMSSVTGNPATNCSYGSITIGTITLGTDIDPSTLRVTVLKSPYGQNDTVTQGWGTLVNGNTIPNIPAGNSYRVFLRGMCSNGTVITSSYATVSVASTATMIDATLVQGTDTDIHGTRIATPGCKNGRIQLRIVGGSLPYRIEVYQGNSIAGPLYDTVTIYGPMFPVSTNLDYRNYYSVLAEAGTYTVKVIDNCGNAPAPILVTVGEANPLSSKFNKSMLC
ncbi:MAG: hypothetical protein LBH30_07260, partial [Prevotellaceae bacterium]|nr:hypothetical protein [Prevotellaceae bacterium]